MSDSDESFMELDSSGSDTELEAFIDFSDTGVSSRASSGAEETSDNTSDTRSLSSASEGSATSNAIEILSSASGSPISVSNETESDPEYIPENETVVNDAIVFPPLRIISQSNISASPPVPRSTVYAPVPSPNYLPASPVTNADIPVAATNNEIAPFDSVANPSLANIAQEVILGGINTPGTSAESQYPSSTSKSKSSKMKSQVANASYEDDGQICPICFEHWTNSGLHRLVSLKCGHLFGQECIEKWIKSSTSKSKCPQCNAFAKKSDIRRIYARFLKVLDTSERDRAIKDLEKEQELRKKIEIEKNQAQLRFQLSLMECERLKKELIDHKSLIEQLRTTNCKGMRIQPFHSAPLKKDKFLLTKTIEISKDGGCRVMAVSNFLPLLVATQPSKNNLFSGFGIKKISTLDFRPAEFVFLHQKDIKDVVFHSHDSLVLTASLDKTVKLTNVFSNSVVQTYNLPTEAWSCSWHKDDNNSFFVGLRNGSVLQMDTRKPSCEVFTIPACIPMSPVVGIQYVQKNTMAPISMSGVLALQLSGCCFFESQGVQEYKAHLLPIKNLSVLLNLVNPFQGSVYIAIL